MSIFNFIADAACLLLWINWRTAKFDPVKLPGTVSLAGTLRKAGPGASQRWQYLAALGVLLVVRAVICWQVGPLFYSSIKLDLGLVPVYFPLAAGWKVCGLMLLFSLLRFLVTAGVFYFWLLILSALNRNVPDKDALQKLVRIHLGWMEPLPGIVKWLAPFLAGAAFWIVCQPVLSHAGIVPPARTFARLLEQSVVIGLGGYMALKWLFVGVLLLHLVNSYVYVGPQRIWNYASETARNLLRPFQGLPLRVGKVDFMPPAAIALIFLVTTYVLLAVQKYAQRLPF
jgi:uncharacterized protein YggT (Ycf19 family)